MTDLDIAVNKVLEATEDLRGLLTGRNTYGHYEEFHDRVTTAFKALEDAMELLNMLKGE